jgi:diacylglycerol kinase family enzyme
VYGAPPPVLPVPLGTGNDLARAMGWGGGVRLHDLDHVTNRVRVGRAAQVDAWKVRNALFVQ